MNEKRFRLSVKMIVILVASLTGFVSLAIANNVVPDKKVEKTVDTSQDFPRVKAYDLFFELDPTRSVFRSRQSIALLNSALSRREITFLIHPDLVIDQIHFTGEAVTGWRFENPVEFNRWYGRVVLNQVTVQFEHEIAPDQTLTLDLEYHLNPGRIQTGFGQNLYELFFSPQSQRAIGFDSGAFPIFEPDSAAPFKMSIKHPESEQCGIPGELISAEVSPKFTTTTYQVDQAYDPAFSCATLQKEQKSAGGATVELYLIPGQPYNEKMSDAALNYFNAYRRLFGNPGLDTFRFVSVEIEGLGGGGENKGNTVYLSKSDNSDSFPQDEENQIRFTALIGHEEFHNWNIFYSNWSGTLNGWWSEGGANFMSAWTGEEIWGKNYGRAVRAQYQRSFDKEMSYFSSGTLESPNSVSESSTWQGEWTLVYNYGALVWEQLRQKVGDDALAAGLREFIQQSARQQGNVDLFIQCLQRHTAVDVAAYLKEWTVHNARIDLSIKQATTRQVGSLFETTAVINATGSSDFELITSLGYKTSASSDWELVPLYTTHLGDTTLTFSSQEIPILFLVDPDNRVPKINTSNDSWPH